MSTPEGRSRARLALLGALIAVVTVAVGTLIGTQIGHKRAAGRNRAAADRAADRKRAAAERERARSAAENRAEQRDEQQEKSLETLDDAVEAANQQLLRAAKAGRSAEVTRAEAKLSDATRRRAAARGGSQDATAKDPYTREVDGFPIKEPPLFAQQITSNESDHVLFVGVSRPYFCLKSPSDRIRIVRETYDPVDRRLRKAGVNDFEVVVTPLTLQAPSRSDALATAAARTVALTARGRAC